MQMGIETLPGFIFPDDLPVTEFFSAAEISGILESYNRSMGNHPLSGDLEMDAGQRMGLRNYFAQVRNAMEIAREINAAVKTITSGQATALQDFLIEDIVTCVWQMEPK